MRPLSSALLGDLTVTSHTQSIALRPHHFLCTLCFQGNGYSSDFINNYQHIVNKLHAPSGDTVSINVVGQSDSVCTPCPHRRGQLCETQEKIDNLDTKHAHILHIKPGDKLTWGEAKSRIAKYMTLASFNTACAPCGWKALGICEATLAQFLQKSTM